jgi:hypothetical protein
MSGIQLYDHRDQPIERQNAVSDDSGRPYYMQERLAELELAMEDQGWRQLAVGGQKEFSRAGLGEIIKMSRLMYLKSPLIKQGVNVQARYVFGRGIIVAAKDPQVNAVVQKFWDDRKNKKALTGHQARMEKEVALQVVGNIFFVLFSDLSTGDVTVRTIRCEQIREIISNPDDEMEPWFYRREWVEQSYDDSGAPREQLREVLYPDWAHNPTDRPKTLYGKPVMWETPVCHLKVGGLDDMNMGVPETYAAIDWARAYKEFLEDWCSITRAYARFAFRFTSQGGARGVAAAKTKFGTTLASGANQTTIETNPTPNVGSTFIGGEGTKFEAFKTAGATTSADDGRRILLMVASAMGLPETFFGDADVGNHATSKTLDRPTELKFLDRQTLWAEFFRDLLDYVIDRAASTPNGRLFGMKLVKNLSSADDAIDDDDIPLRSDPGSGEAIDSFVGVDFPKLLEHDVVEQVQAIVSAATLDGYQLAGTMDLKTLSKMLLTELGATEVDEMLRELFPEGEPPITGKPPADAIRLAAAQVKRLPAPAGNAPNDTTPQQSLDDDLARSATATEAAMLRRAAHELREALKGFHKKWRYDAAA